MRAKANELLFDLPFEKQGDEDKRIAVHDFDMLQCPQREEPWKMVSIIGLFFDDGLQYPCPSLVCDSVSTLDSNMVDDKAQIKAARTKQSARSKITEFRPRLQARTNNWDIVLHQLNNGDSICKLYHALLLSTPKRVINQASQVTLNV